MMSYVEYMLAKVEMETERLRVLRRVEAHADKIAADMTERYAHLLPEGARFVHDLRADA